MSRIKKRLWEDNYAPGTATTFYTVPAGQYTDITYMTAMNSDASTAYTLTVHSVQSGDTADAENMVQSISIGPKETRVLFEMYNKTLNPGDFISILASTAGKITVHGSGVEYTQ